MLNILTICPESLRTQANNLAGVAGKSMADLQTFDLAPKVQDAKGNTVRWCNAACSNGWLQNLGKPLQLPDYDDGTLDLADAQTLLASAIFLTPDMMAEGMPVPTVDRLVVAPNMDASTVKAWLGLTEIPED